MIRLEKYLKNKYIFNGIKYSINNLFQKDYLLLKSNIHEQAISHKIACYLEKELKLFMKKEKLFIDCEYNKIWKDFKELKEKWISLKKVSGSFVKIYKKKKIIFDELWKIFLKEGKYYLIACEELSKLIIWKKINSKENEFFLFQKRVRPDIIIHNRWDNSNNLCVFEIKKNKLEDIDILKLKWLTDKKLNFWYNYWIWLSEFNYKEKRVRITLYINWKETLKRFLVI